MAIEDHLPAPRGLKTAQPPSRVRMKLRALSDDLQNASYANARFQVANSASLSTAQVLAEIAEAQAEWDRLDKLLMAARTQRKRIATRAGAFIEFVDIMRMHMRIRAGKKRRPLTLAEKVVAAAKLRVTRKLRNTMGNRQKQHLKA